MRALTLAVILISGLLVVVVGEALAVEQGFTIQWNPTEQKVGQTIKSGGETIGHGLKIAGQTVGRGAKVAGQAVGQKATDAYNWLFSGEPEDEPICWDYPGQEPKKDSVSKKGPRKGMPQIVEI